MYPGWSLYGSRDYLRGQWEQEGKLGELKYYADRRWNNGVAPFPAPIAKLIGKEECVALGETELPPAAIHFESGETTIEITVNDRETTIGITWEATPSPPQAVASGIAFGQVAIDKPTPVANGIAFGQVATDVSPAPTPVANGIAFGQVATDGPPLPTPVANGIAFGQGIEDVAPPTPVANGIAFGQGIEDVAPPTPVANGIAFGQGIEDVAPPDYLPLEFEVQEEPAPPWLYVFFRATGGSPIGGRFRVKVADPSATEYWLSWYDWDAESGYGIYSELAALSGKSFGGGSGGIEFSNGEFLLYFDTVEEMWSIVDWESEITHT